MAPQHIDAAQVRRDVRDEWTALAPYWGAPEMGAEEGPPRARVIAMAGIRSGQRVLDLTCGPGNATLPVHVGAAGFVLGLDISLPMIETAQHWAQQHNLCDVEFRLIEDELHLDVPGASFDAATCMFGLMYMPDPVAVLRVVRDALKPGGRLAVSTWASLERCSFLSVPLQIVRHHVEHPLLEMRGPNPCALPTAEALEQAFVATGFTDMETYTLDNPFEFESADAFWDDMSTIGWPLGFLRPSLSDWVMQAIHVDTIATLAALFPDGSPQVTSEVILAAGASGVARRTISSTWSWPPSIRRSRSPTPGS